VTRRRLALAASAAVLGLATFGATSATADTVPTRVAARDGYIACVAVDAAQVGTCLRNPIPDPRVIPRPGDVLGGVLP